MLYNADLLSTEYSNNSCSPAEKRICAYLKKKGYPYVREVSFPGSLYRYDFLIKLPKQCILLEYHGEQHYIIDGKYNKNVNDLLMQQWKDQEKKDLALKNGIILIIINKNNMDNIREIIASI